MTMWLLPALLLLTAIVLSVPLSGYFAWLMDGKYRAPRVLKWFEDLVDTGPQDWKQYAIALVVFNIALYASTRRAGASRRSEGPNTGNSTKGPACTPQWPRVWPKSSLFLSKPAELAGSSIPPIPTVELSRNRPRSVADAPKFSLQGIIQHDRGHFKIVEEIADAGTDRMRHHVHVALRNRLGDRPIEDVIEFVYAAVPGLPRVLRHALAIGR